MKRNAFAILTDMHKILHPGEYGMGTEPGSVPDDDKKAWERMGELHDELSSLLYNIVLQIEGGE